MKRLITTFALVLTLPLALSAQQEEHQRMRMHQQQGMHQGMGMQHMMAGMHGMMMASPGPGMILRLQETLELTEDQVSALESMHAEARETMQQHRQAASEAREKAHEAMTGESADIDAFQAGLEEAAMHEVQAMVAMARVHMQAGDVLTDAQTEKLHTLMEAMKEMHHEGMGQGEGMQHRMQRRQHQGMRSGG